MTARPIGRPRFVTVHEALGWQEMALAQDGGLSGLRDLPLLESALAMPRQGFAGQFAHSYPFEMAAAYAFHVAKNHPFFDGNKRAALLCCGGFLRMNGWDLVSTGTEVADAILELIAGTMDKQRFAEWLEARCKARPSLELRDFFSLLTPEIMQSLRDGTVEGSDAEIAASFQEANLAIPLIQSLVAQTQHCLQSGDTQGQMAAALHIALLQLLYRAAEELGYEW